jgi:hypothetical protein
MGKNSKKKDDGSESGKRPYIKPLLIVHTSILFTTTDVGAQIT